MATSFHATMLDDTQKQQIIAKQQSLGRENKLPPQQLLDQQYAGFQRRYRPDVLAGLQGEALLNYMHDHSNRDSLVYWLEFKNDDEFKSSQFGSIAGGSALKFRIFRRKETGNWQAADRSNNPQDISMEQAIEMAVDHRNQLTRGVALLEALPENATDDDYARLQSTLDEVAPDVSRLAWGHKYYCLLFPEKLDDFHNPEWQRFHLLKLMQVPPEGDGRFLCAGRYVAAAREAGLSVIHLTHVLNALHGALHRYWRIGTHSEASDTSHWPMMLDRGCVAVGWPQLGDLSWVEAKRQSRAELKDRLEQHYPNHPTAIGNTVTQLVNFVAQINEGDVIVAADGANVVGLGRVVGEYRYAPEFDFAHQRAVQWLDTERWEMPISTEGLRSTVRQLHKHSENILAIERRLQAASGPAATKTIMAPVNQNVRLAGIPGQVHSILERKGQVILYGPPGTGKTYWAERTANDLAALSAFGRTYSALDDEEREVVHGQQSTSGLVRWCCFHPAYGYEDFIEGYRPHSSNGQVAFELRDGVFKALCREASANPGRNYYLVVDEINRGDVPRIFGELLTILEKDKRDKQIILPLSQQIFSVPRNVYLIGTMNTADRSISLLDAALRRRFGFVELMPDASVLRESVVGGITLRAWLEALNERIREHVGRDARNLQLGHSYLMHSGIAIKDFATLKRAIRDDVIPLLEEYCYEDYTTLAILLGEELVDVSRQRIRHDLFDDGQEDSLTAALLNPFADIGRSTEALASDEADSQTDEVEEANEP